MLLDITRQTPLLPQTSSEIKPPMLLREIREKQERVQTGPARFYGENSIPFYRRTVVQNQISHTIHAVAHDMQWTHVLCSMHAAVPPACQHAHTMHNAGTTNMHYVHMPG
jgi:hypothetical protein